MAPRRVRTTFDKIRASETVLRYPERDLPLTWIDCPEAAPSFQKAVWCSVTMTTYNPISANLKATKPAPGGEAKGNCVAAKRGGKQPEAKEQSQILMNSIT